MGIPEFSCLPYGPNGLLIRFADAVGDASFARARAIIADLEADPPAGLIEFVPAFTTVLLEFDPEVALDVKAHPFELLARLKAAVGRAPAPNPVKTISVTYNGPDLESLAQHHGLTPDEVIRLHTEPIYKVYMLGFSPGFPYLGDLNPRLHTRRLATPRPRVVAGSVGIGGEHTGIYSVDSPGGWNIIGHSTVRLFDPGADGTDKGEAMFMLRPGDRIRFVPI